MTQEIQRTGGMERTEVRPPVSYVVMYIPVVKYHNMVHIYLRNTLVFYCSMYTSRIIRVGTRTYVIRIAAVSQGQVSVCITRKNIRAENCIVSVLVSKLTWLLRGWSKWIWFQCGGSELASLQWCTEIDLVLCEGRKWLGLESGSKLTCFLCGGVSKLTCF